MNGWLRKEVMTIVRENSDEVDNGVKWEEEKVMVAREITTFCEACVMRSWSTIVKSKF